MGQTVGRNVGAPLLFLNLILYLFVVGLASWNLNKFINGQTHHPGIDVLLLVILLYYLFTDFQIFLGDVEC